jgi:UDP-N-acetylmuramoyl-L-alanyl-D-glutamate--2,6-diaminopimelate ligase
MVVHLLRQLCHTLPAYTLSSPENPLITGIISDSRQPVAPGNLFVAFKGFSVDRHRFIPDVVQRGVTAVVVEQDAQIDLPDSVTVVCVPDGREALAYLLAAWYGYPSQKMTVIGVTGTDGKTSTINLIYAILRQAGQRVGMISTVNALIGDQALDTGFHVTTPEAPDIQRYMAQMVEAGTEICLLETTSHGLAQHRVTACDYDWAVVTNITHEHLNHHNNSLDEYRLAKARLFDTLAQQGAILNIDDWSYNFLRERIQQRIPIISYGWQSAANVTATEIDLAADATRFTAHLAGEPYQVVSPLVGAFNVSNILAALATTVVALQLPAPAALTALQSFVGVPGRMERIDVGQPFTAIVDFAHAPEALRRALQVARTLTARRVIAVFGCAGERDVAKRTMMGHIAAELADVTIITAEDPRSEDLTQIMAMTAQAMLEKGVVEGESFYQIPDRGRAIYFATQLAQAGDVVIALGKGHEQSMCFGNTEYPWDDRDAMRGALAGQPLLTLPTA